MTEPPLLYQATTQLEALRDWMEDRKPAELAAVYKLAMPTGATAPFWLLEFATGGGPFGPPMGGDQWTDLRVLVRSCGRTTDQAARAADAARALLAGRDGDGAYLSPMVLAGLAAIHREAGRDVVADVLAGVPQVSESFQVLLGADDTA